MSVSVIQVKKGLKATFFETIYLTLTAYFEGENVRYEFVRKVRRSSKNQTLIYRIKRVIQILRGLFGPSFTR